MKSHRENWNKASQRGKMSLIIFAPSMSNLPDLQLSERQPLELITCSDTCQKSCDFGFYALLSVIQNTPRCCLLHSCQRLLSLGLPGTTSFHWQWLKETTSKLQNKAYRLKILYTSRILLKGSKQHKDLCNTD